MDSPTRPNIEQGPSPQSAGQTSPLTSTKSTWAEGQSHLGSRPDRSYIAPQSPPLRPQPDPETSVSRTLCRYTCSQCARSVNLDSSTGCHASGRRREQHARRSGLGVGLYLPLHLSKWEGAVWLSNRSVRQKSRHKLAQVQGTTGPPQRPSAFSNAPGCGDGNRLATAPQKAQKWS